MTEAYIVDAVRASIARDRQATMGVSRKTPRAPSGGSMRSTREGVPGGGPPQAVPGARRALRAPLSAPGEVGPRLTAPPTGVRGRTGCARARCPG